MKTKIIELSNKQISVKSKSIRSTYQNFVKNLFKKIEITVSNKTVNIITIGVFAVGVAVGVAWLDTAEPVQELLDTAEPVQELLDNVDKCCINPEWIDKSAMCPMIYSPVLGCNNIKYANKCRAESKGVSWWTHQSNGKTIVKKWKCKA
jgi:hypothetical protein